MPHIRRLWLICQRTRKPFMLKKAQQIISSTLTLTVCKKRRGGTTQQMDQDTALATHSLMGALHLHIGHKRLSIGVDLVSWRGSFWTSGGLIHSPLEVVG